MDRRNLLRSVVATLLGGHLVPGLARARPAPILLQRSPLAGFQYHRGERLWPQLRPGQSLALIREPENPYDGRAVRIDWNGAKLGYLPRLDNAAVSQLLDRGQPLEARIAGLAESRDPWQRVAVEVYLVTDGSASDAIPRPAR